MQFQEIAAALGVESYPAALEEYYFKRTALPLDFSLLGSYAAEAEEAYQSLRPAQRAWQETVSCFLQENEQERMREFPTPESDGTLAGDYLPLLILLPLIPAALERYRTRGFSEEQVQNIAESFQECIELTARRTGRRGYNRGYFNWQYLYIRGVLFPFGSFNYELKRLDEAAFILQNRTTRELMPLMAEGRFHAQGMHLGVPGFEAEEGAFSVDFSEDEQFFYGYPVKNGRVVNQKTAFSKEEWRIALRPGDETVSVHIPARTDLSREAVQKSYRDGFAYIEKYFPHFKPKAYYCASWLMEPALRTLLGDCRITQFMEDYVKYPHQSNGKEVLTFIFPGFQGPYEELPENTRLERELKKIYVNGGHIYAYRGVFLP